MADALQEAVELLKQLNYKKITELDKIEEMTNDDTLVLVSAQLGIVGRVTAKDMMEWFNDNLKNFICWRPIVEDNTLKWVRDKLDIAPDDIKFSELIFPEASEEQSGVITPDMYIHIMRSMSEFDGLATKQELSDGLAKKAEKVHYHEQYATNDSLNAFKQDVIDADYVRNEFLESIVKAKGFIKISDIPLVSSTNNGFMSSSMLAQLDTATSDIATLKSGKADKTHYHDQYVTKTSLDEIIGVGIPRKTSDLVNDVGWVTDAQVTHPKATHTVVGGVVVPSDSSIDINETTHAIDIKPFNTTNLLINSNFAEYRQDGNLTVFPGWYRYPNDNAAMSITNGTPDSNLNTLAVCHLFNGTGFAQQLRRVGSDITRDLTVSFYAYAESAKAINVSLFGKTVKFNLTTSWKLYTADFTIVDGESDSIAFTGADADTDDVDVYFTHIMCQYGPNYTGWVRYYSDIIPADMLPKASAVGYGVAKVDGDTIYVDNEGIMHASNFIGNKPIAVIDDGSEATDVTWSGRYLSNKFTGVNNSINTVHERITGTETYFNNLIDDINISLLNRGTSLVYDSYQLSLLGVPSRDSNGNEVPNVLSTVTLPVITDDEVTALIADARTAANS